jgi:hypothetical protein
MIFFWGLGFGEEGKERKGKERKGKERKECSVSVAGLSG